MITAALGPTNTGKTHQAVECMLSHDSGMIGLPLRLLAREVYDRVTARIGEAHVALITGEEKRIPPRPKYWICTTEAMPLSHSVDFVAVDEIQLAAHPERGHVFTDRILHARGRRETWFMGADTIEPLLTQLVPTAQIRHLTRLSKLTSMGSVTLGALPPRTAVVGFSAAQVYEIAEKLRLRRGGAAVVLGALSPRTRNAQVAMYQAGEVEYMVATDAIGMGLNMDVDLVVFASVRKFDGKDLRPLDAPELGQIAGRAGRHLNDGKFATLAPQPPLPQDLTFALETHRFPALHRLVWRNSDLDTSSIESVIDSLNAPPPRQFLRRVQHAEDYGSLVQLASMPQVRALARGKEAVSLLWEVCQIPDYRQLLFGEHLHLLTQIFVQLASSRASLDGDWIARQIERLDDIDGDVETLTTRIAFTRTWTYVAHRLEWIKDAQHWQERTRAIEDRLSDALHERLVQRFVEPGRSGQRKRSRAASRRTHASAIEAGIDTRHANGPFSALAKLKLALARVDSVPGTETGDWVRDLVDAPHDRFRVDFHGRILDGATAIGRMTRGVDLLRPDVQLTLADEIGKGARAQILRRLLAFTRDMVDALVAPLRAPAAAELSPPARGLLYQVEQRLGTALVSEAREQVTRLSRRDRDILAALSIQIGSLVIFVPSLLKPGPVEQRLSLCSAYFGSAPPTQVPAPACVCMNVDPRFETAAYTRIGFPVFGPKAIRADLAERIHVYLALEPGEESFAVPSQVARWLGCRIGEVPPIARAFGYRVTQDGHFEAHQRRGRTRQSR